MKILAKRVSTIDFSKYGRYYNMKESSDIVIRDQGDGWEDARTKLPLIDTAGHIGYTFGSPTPCVIQSMERHTHTQEALFCLSDPFVIAMANSGNSDEPIAEDIEAVIVHPGEIIVLNRGIWHDACHGIKQGVHYYWMATELESEPNIWVDIKGGPVQLVVD